jgi:hypothetical protein
VVAVETKKKFVLALIAFAVVAGLEWATLSNEPVRILDVTIRLRTAALVILGLFVVRAGLYFWRTQIEAADKGRHDAAESQN